MEVIAVRYPTIEHRTYRPGSKGLNKHYKAHREQYYGHKGILQTSFKSCKSLQVFTAMQKSILFSNPRA